MSVQPILATKPSLTLKRQLKAKPDKVYAAWTDPEKILKWFGPDKIDVLSAEADARSAAASASSCSAPTARSTT